MVNKLPGLAPATLIKEGDPPPFTVLNADGKASMLLVCDHASQATPHAMGHIGLDKSAFELHVAWDIGAEDVTRILSEKLDAAAVLAGYSRLLIDVNRQPGDPGSIPEKSETTIIPGNFKLSEEQQLARVESFFWPYHQSVAKALAHLWQRGPAPALFSIHSFTPSLGGKKRHWDISVLWNRDPRLAMPLLEKLKAVENRRYYVGDNVPYSGRELAYTIDIHAGAAGLPNCAVEIRQDLIDTPDGAQYWANTLADIFEEILAHKGLHSVEHF
jgi:predicted N-formylglutamate amidohydrolase